MTPEVEKKRRELFDKWCDEQGHGRASTRRMLWQAFNAALDAVEIELPREVADTLQAQYYSTYIIAMRQCHLAIEKTGLGLRIK